MDIRYSRALDEIYLHQWLKDPKLSRFLPCEGEEEIRIFSRHWMFFALRKAGLSVLIDDHCVAMGMLILMPYQKVQHHALLQIIVDPAHFKRGVGNALMKNLLHLAKEYLHLDLVFLELIGPTPALPFFKKWGFELYATQQGYVEGDLPDKLLLGKSLI